MSKELFVSSTPHETKVAIVEDDQLAEIYFERENEYTLAGSIYKGRVTRVLPGMQSAFVEIGLERDAFLYVTDFMEHPDDEAEFDTIPADDRNRRQAEAPAAQPGRQKAAPVAEAEAEAEESDEPVASEPEQRHDSQAATTRAEPGPGNQSPEDRDSQNGGRWGRKRRRGRRGRNFPESKFARPDAEPKPERGRERNASPAPAYEPIILPGESISKYRNLAQRSAAPAATEARPEPNKQLTDNGPEPATIYPAEAHTYHEEHSPGSHPYNEEQSPEAHPYNEEQSSEAVASAPRRPTEEIDVAAILHQRAEAERGGDGRSRREAPYTETPRPGTAHAFAAAGTVEEEEIDEEELDHPGFMQEVDDADFDELEEETLDRSGRVASQAGVSTAEEHHAEAAEQQSAHSDVEDEGEDEIDHDHEQNEFATSEQHGASEQYSVSSESSEEAPEHEASGHNSAESNGRAEVRGPSGYQQKVAVDRQRGRNRRGGRRMRGGPRHQRGPMPQIAELLKEGQEILVQIAKEPMGKKGARITSHIALPGRFLVYMPTVNHNGVSRKISSPDERDRLKRIIASERQQHQGGFIVRTAAAAASEEDLRADIRFLLNLWTEIRSRAESSKAPALIYHDLNLVERVLRDQVTEGFSHIWVDSEQEYERVLRFINRFQPSLVKRVKLYTKETPLFEQFNIQDEINKALKSKVWLKSGGYIVINQTEALVAIDVNTGKYVGKTQRLEDTIVKTNVDAIKEIVRQIRLRDLGGIIVIDFIDMDERKNRQKVMAALDEALKNDRAPSKVLQFNDFGLVAITRKRVKQSLERTLGQPCTYCTGTGLIKSVATICNEVYVELRKLHKHLERGDVIVRVNPEVGKALKANNARWLSDMEELTGKTVIVKPDPTLHQEQFDIH